MHTSYRVSFDVLAAIAAPDAFEAIADQYEAAQAARRECESELA